MLILKLYFLISIKLDVTTVRTNNIVCDLLCNENVHTANLIHRANHLHAN